MSPEQIVEVQRNLAWQALDQKEAEANIAQTEIARLRRVLDIASKELTTLRAKLKEIERQVARL